MGRRIYAAAHESTRSQETDLQGDAHFLRAKEVRATPSLACLFLCAEKEAIFVEACCVGGPHAAV